MLWEYMKANLLRYDNAEVYNREERVVFKELVVQAESFAKRLGGQKYGICCKSDVQSVKAILACLAAGVTAVPLSGRYGDVHRQRIMEAMDISDLIVDEEGRLAIQRTGLGQKWEPELEEVAWILPTSGTTGIPKGVMLTRNAILQNLNDSNHFFLSKPGDTILAGRGFFHCSSLTGELLMSLIRGVNICCYEQEFEPMKLLEAMEREKITLYSGTPTVFYYLCRMLRKIGTRSLLRYCNIGGEPMHKQSLELIRQVLPETQFVHSYGMTETCSRATYYSLNQEQAQADCVGQMLESYSVCIVDEKGNAISSNQEGQVLIAGPCVMKGYYGNPDKTRQILDGGWLRTGDIGWLDEQGFLHVKGRRDDMIIRAGVNIYPKEIEEILKKQSCIDAVRVYSEKGIGIARRLIAEVMLKEGRQMSQKELVELCKESLPLNLMPDQVRVMNDELIK